MYVMDEPVNNRHDHIVVDKEVSPSREEGQL